jgi:hypothetical protein
MQQYPDTIVITITTPPVQDESTGVFTPGSTSTQSYSCRAEVNGTGRQIAGKDGSLIDYAFICYLPKMTTVIPDSVDYVLTTLANGTLTGKVKRASNGQLNSRLWL